MAESEQESPLRAHAERDVTILGTAFRRSVLPSVAVALAATAVVVSIAVRHNPQRVYCIDPDELAEQCKLSWRALAPLGGSWFVLVLIVALPIATGAFVAFSARSRRQ